VTVDNAHHDGVMSDPAGLITQLVVEAGPGQCQHRPAISARQQPGMTESRMTHVILRAWGLTEPDNAGMQTLYGTAATAISNAVVGAFDLG
jgi:hypothetical protein